MDGEADIDPDKPQIDLQLQQQELLTKSVAIGEALDLEQLSLLNNDIEKFADVYKKYRQAYYIRLGSLSCFCLGMICLMLSFSLYYSANLNVRQEFETCTKENLWSTWKSHNDVLNQRERCKSTQYVNKTCPTTCSRQPGSPSNVARKFFDCSIEDNSTLYT